MSGPGDVKKIGATDRLAAVRKAFPGSLKTSSLQSADHPPADVRCSECDQPVPTIRAAMALCEACHTRLDLRNERRRVCGVSPRHLRLRDWKQLRPPADGADQWRAAVRAVQTFLGSDTGSILALIGQRGTGKTQLAAVAVWSAIEAGRSARMVTITRLLADLKVRYGADGGDAAWLDYWGEPSLLVIDEIAERIDSAWSASMLTALIDERYAAMRSTVLVGNISADGFADVVGPSIASRTNEDGGLVVCDWSSFREVNRVE